MVAPAALPVVAESAEMAPAAPPVEAGTEDSQGPASAPAAEAQVLDEEEKESGDSASLTLLATAARHLESI